MAANAIVFVVFLLASALLYFPCAAQSVSCPAAERLAGTGRDASEALSDCVERTPAGGRLELASGDYVLQGPVILDKSLTLATKNFAGSSGDCGTAGAQRCATFLLRPDKSRFHPGDMPILVNADGVSLTNIVIWGAQGIDLRWDREICTSANYRPLAGAVRVNGSDFSLIGSAIGHLACYTSLEVSPGMKRLTILRNRIGPDGTHVEGMWGDGITIGGSEDAVVSQNHFVDNTDVQLVFGGCRACRIEFNRFEQTGPFERGSFAALMLQAWPGGSGDYEGTIVRGNVVDCSTLKRCGFGLMIGASPWYTAPTFGGAVVENQIYNAQIGINIDGLTGPMLVGDNTVRNSGGRFNSDCGTRDWPAVNIAPSSRRYVKSTVAEAQTGSVSTGKCLLNRYDRKHGE